MYYILFSHILLYCIVVYCLYISQHMVCVWLCEQIFDFELSPSDIDAINKLNRDLRRGAPVLLRNGSVLLLSAWWQHLMIYVDMWCLWSFYWKLAKSMFYRSSVLLQLDKVYTFVNFMCEKFGLMAFHCLMLRSSGIYWSWNLYVLWDFLGWIGVVTRPPLWAGMREREGKVPTPSLMVTWSITSRDPIRSTSWLRSI